MATQAPTATHNPMPVWSHPCQSEATHSDLEPPTPIWRLPTQSQSWEERGFTVSRERKRVESVRERDEKKKKKKEERGQKSLKWEEERR